MDENFSDLNQMLPEKERQEIERLCKLVEKTPSLSAPAAPWLCRLGIHRYTKWWSDRFIRHYPLGTVQYDESTLYLYRELIQHRICKGCYHFDSRAIRS